LLRSRAISTALTGAGEPAGITDGRAKLNAQTPNSMLTHTAAKVRKRQDACTSSPDLTRSLNGQSWPHRMRLASWLARSMRKGQSRRDLTPAARPCRLLILINVRIILPYPGSERTHIRQRVAIFPRKIRNLSPEMIGSTISADRKTGIIFLTFTA
jgi:hypothetical protein